MCFITRSSRVSVNLSENLGLLTGGESGEGSKSQAYALGEDMDTFSKTELERCDEAHILVTQDTMEVAFRDKGLPQKQTSNLPGISDGIYRL